jgi:uncharacterized protein (TIRG00374 family)
MRNKIKISIVSYMLCGIFVIAFIVAVDWKKAYLVIGSMPSLGLALYCLAITATMGIGWCRYKVIIGGNLTWKTTGYLYFLSKAGGSMTPARIGDFVPMIYKEFRTGEIFSAIIIDKVLELYCMFFFGCIGLFGLRNLPAPATIAVGCGFTVLTALFILLCNRSLWDQLVGFVQRRNAGIRNPALRYMHSAVCKVLVLAQKASSVVARLGWKYLILIGLAFCSYALSLIAAKILFSACSISISLFLILELMTVSGLVTIFSFIPGGVGVSEVSLLLLLSLYGVSRESFAAYAVMSRSINILILIGLYVVFVFLVKQKDAQRSGISLPDKQRSADLS